jgi:plastocyanin
MTLRWAICFSLAALSLSAATVTGRVELRDSHDPAVRNRADFSGVVVSLRSVQGGAVPQSDTKHAVMLQKGKAFKPHVLAVPMGSMVDFPNADPIFHNAFSSYSGQIFDVGLYPPGSTRSVRFGREGIVRVFCNIHSSMSALIAVVATPYFAVTKRDGAFEIADVPPGEYDMTVFHERATEPALQALTRRVTVGPDGASLPALGISEAGYLSIPHKNKYGRDYPPETGEHVAYPTKK